ncbi:DUF1476 family protein [Agrobacterium vitis]|uniref:DUF1476 family protein n=3 Tax=Agrobacterium vitis TaxID=373 RepID=A0AAE5AWG1_AGRVI|nr:DUF1476 family protein [Allorhizobium sp. Av2]MUZ58494.1 DUF1476 family protein [Agrobacterium vitis]MVA65813.1 DUF1476 family protein [Agrobacterium vitis]MVA88166.1 DUF1476 family protein [Agrobacterium vitis]
MPSHCLDLRPAAMYRRFEQGQVMTKLHDRGHAMVQSVSGADWCPKDDTTFTIRARRNVLAGFWAGERLGLRGQDLVLYAQALHVEDHRLPGDLDLVEKIQADFASAELAISTADIHLVLRASHQQALRDSGCTD